MVSFYMLYSKIEIKVKDGYYIFKLGDVLNKKNITMNKICTDLEIEYIVIKRLTIGNLSRIDLSVVSRICDYLKCNLSDIIEYIPYKK